MQREAAPLSRNIRSIASSSVQKNLGTIRVLHFELKHRYSKTLFGETFFEVVYFGMAQLGFEQALIPINVPLMDT
jgi:hypothetical protein